MPCPPLTPLFHVHLPVPPAALRHAADALLADRGVRMFGRERSSDDPNRSSFEITVSEPALGFSPTEVAQLVRELVDRAR